LLEKVAHSQNLALAAPQPAWSSPTDMPMLLAGRILTLPARPQARWFSRSVLAGGAAAAHVTGLFAGHLGAVARDHFAGMAGALTAGWMAARAKGY
jgi:hypothetical protein